VVPVDGQGDPVLDLRHISRSYQQIANKSTLNIIGKLTVDQKIQL
jgi:hypothetical protein